MEYYVLKKGGRYVYLIEKDKDGNIVSVSTTADIHKAKMFCHMPYLTDITKQLCESFGEYIATKVKVAMVPVPCEEIN